MLARDVIVRLFALLIFLAEIPLGAEDFDQSHSSYAEVLAKYVRNGRVDYSGLKAVPARLDDYLQELASVHPEAFAKWPEADRLALLLNLYNAWTLRLIVDHYPLKSIRSIGFLPGAAWRQLIVRFGGEKMTLDHLENQIIRPLYKEPRAHFALVCAARGCPQLRSEPYVGARLDEQLDDQGRQFMSTEGKNRFEPETSKLWLSPIFKWYRDDFTEDAGSLKQFVMKFFPEATRKALENAGEVKIDFTDYDWSLNRQEN